LIFSDHTLFYSATRSRKLMRTTTFSSISLGIIATSCLYANPAQALSFTAELEEFTGDNAAGKITIEDGFDGGIKFTAEITSPTISGDISGLWFGLKDTSLLSSLNISEFVATGEETVINGIDPKYYFDSSLSPKSCVSNDSGPNNLNGGADKEFCKSGLTNGLISFGAGSSEGLVQKVTFLLSSTTSSLTVADFNQAFGLRYQSTGISEKGSSKLTSKRCYYPGYKGTMSDTFDCSNGIPEKAVPVGGFKNPEDDPMYVDRSSDKNESKDKNENKNKNESKNKNKNKNK